MFSAKAMIIEITVSQTSVGFSSMQTGGVFYYCHAIIVNIINCVRAQIQYLQEKMSDVAQIHTQDNTYKCIRVKRYEEKLHYCILHLSVINHMLFLSFIS